jgi:hypothetical protein
VFFSNETVMDTADPLCCCLSNISVNNRSRQQFTQRSLLPALLPALQTGRFSKASACDVDFGGVFGHAKDA